MALAEEFLNSVTLEKAIRKRKKNAKVPTI